MNGWGGEYSNRSSVELPVAEAPATTWPLISISLAWTSMPAPKSHTSMRILTLGRTWVRPTWGRVMPVTGGTESTPTITSRKMRASLS